jgi:acetolactate synthase-1/2/3 large subunit
MNGAQWLVQALQAQGVERIFVLCGNGLRPFLDACIEAGLPLVDVRNEQAAAYMADATARLTRRLAVVATSAGPGFGNALTGILNSYWDGAPTLLISGDSDSATRGMGHFQELDQVAITATVCKYARWVSSSAVLPADLASAVNAATSPRPGPAHLCIPSDVFTQVVEPRSIPLPPLDVPPGREPDAGEVEALAAALAAARSPLLVAGSGCFYARAGEALHEFARRADLPIFTPLWDRGCVSESWPQYVGVTSPEVNGAYRCLPEADVIVTVGARVDFRLGFGRPPVIGAEARFFRIDADRAEIRRGRPADLAIVADPQAALLSLAEAYSRAGGKPKSEWLAHVRAARDAFLREWEPRGRREGLPVPSLRIVREIEPFMDDEVTFCLDGGNIGRWAHMLLWKRHPEHWLTCGISGVVGWGLPGAAAARLARPGHPVLLLSGDGAAGFTLGEIETALRFDAPYVAVVAVDDAWGIEADARPPDYRHATLLGDIRFDRVAEALGARGVYIEDARQLGPAISAALAVATVTVIHVPTELAGIDYYRRHLTDERLRQ